MIPPPIIQNILEASRIEEVVGDFVTLRKRGASLIGLCPFHNEKTPSFNVSPARGIFKCFGCGKAGNSLKFIMEHEKLTYPEALRYLARKYNITIEEQEETPEQREAQNERESLLAVNARAARFFSDRLLESEDGKAIGLTYFQDRGFNLETIKKFQLGYAPDAWDDLTQTAIREGFQLPYLEKTGLTVLNQDHRYDRFRSRVIFPIHGLSGRVIGFGGRVIGQEEKKAKYINSPESEIYHKSDTLYGIYFARTAIANADECYLVEGYTDVISLHQAGFANAVASSGTSLTLEQIKLIKRFTRNITILYDGDEAGIRASFRGIDMILEQGMQVRIVLFPDGDDPDSYVRKHRQSEVKEFLSKQAVNFILFKTRLLHAEAQNDPIKRTQLIREIVQSIALIPDALSRNEYLRECSNILEVSEQSLINELNRDLRKAFVLRNKDQQSQSLAGLPEPAAIPEPQPQFEADNSAFQEKELIRLLLLYGNETIVVTYEEDPEQHVQISVADYIIQDLQRDDIRFVDPDCQTIYEEFAACRGSDAYPGEKHFMHHPSENIALLSINLLNSRYILSKNWEEKKRIFINTERDLLYRAVTSGLLALKLKRLDAMIHENQKMLKTSLSEKEVIEQIHKQRIMTETRKILSHRLGRIIPN